MSKNEATVDMLQNDIKRREKQIDGWCRQIEDLQDEIQKLNRWINAAQFYIDGAQEMLIDVQELEGCE